MKQALSSRNKGESAWFFYQRQNHRSAFFFGLCSQFPLVNITQLVYYVLGHIGRLVWNATSYDFFVCLASHGNTAHQR